MNIAKNAHQIIKAAETAMRQLIAECLDRNDYTQIAELATLAEVLNKLRKGEHSNEPATFTASPVAAKAKSGARKKPTVPDRQKTFRKAGEFPRFERVQDKLVKVGWSKKNRSSYEHRVSYDAVLALTRQLAGKVSDGKIFTVDALMPVSGPADDGEIPVYQVYLIVAWLRHVGAIEKRGRDGYILRRGTLTTDRLQKLWSVIPTRKT
jgi:hypothetical protein